MRKYVNKQKFIQKNSEEISTNYILCNFCSVRLTSKKNKDLNQKCFICKNIFEEIDNIVIRILESIESYEFSSFETGIIIKPSLIDRDDHIKSEFQIKGVSSVKSNINNELSKKLARKTKTGISHTDSDLVIKVDFKDSSYEIKSKPIYIYGRYTKASRTITQKQYNCTKCLGKGCYTCNFHGLQNFDSVGGQITKFLIKKFDCEQVKINWIGGEEKSSLVVGNGRPFFAKMINPKKRRKIVRGKTNLEGIQLLELRKINEPPKGQILFKSKVEIIVETDDQINDRMLNNLELLDMPLQIHVDGKKSSPKNIYKIRSKKISSKLLKVNIHADGGIPIKSFIQSSYVVPNFTDLLKSECKCVQFDFKKIDVMS